MKHAVLREKIGNMVVKNIFVTEIPNNTLETMTLQRYCERNKEKFLEKGSSYLEENTWCRGVSEEERNKKREYVKNRYNMSEEDKQKLKEHKINWICSMS